MIHFAVRFSFSRLKNLLGLGLVGLAAAQAQGQAQGRFCLGGDLDHLSTAQRATCSAQLAAVRSAAVRFGAPEGWHFVMVCGEEGWQAYTPFSTHSAAELEHASADTDLVARSTYFRGSMLTVGATEEIQDRVLAREIAAIVLGSRDEQAIKARVELWKHHGLLDAGKPAPVLQASR